MDSAFRGTPSRIGGMTFRDLAEEVSEYPIPLALTLTLTPNPNPNPNSNPTPALTPTPSPTRTPHQVSEYHELAFARDDKTGEFKSLMVNYGFVKP